MSYFDTRFLTAPNKPPPREVMELVSDFVAQMRLASESLGLGPYFGTLTQHGNAFVATDQSRVYFGVDPQSGPTGWYSHDYDGATTLDQFIRDAQQQLGFSRDAHYVYFDRALAAAGSDQRAHALAAIAERFTHQELAEASTRSANLVKPIFGDVPSTIDPKLCFVIMPFSDTLRPVYEDTYRLVAGTRGLQTQRSDEIFSTGPVIQDVWKGIATARVIIADLTGRNANVFYELGVAHTLGRDVILTAQSIDDVPFDLRHLRVVTYEYTPRGMQAFAESLSKTIESILRPPTLSVHP